MIYRFAFIILILSLSACDNVEQQKDNSMVKHAKAETVSNTNEAKPTLLEIEIDSSISIDYLMGKFNPEMDKNFIKIEKKYASRTGMYLHKKTYEAFKKMHALAKTDGINLTIRSATRNFKSQKGIWEAKWTGQRKVEGGQDVSKTIPDPKQRALKILEYSSMPSTSRHHWGTDIDINAFTNEYFSKGKGKKEYDWLVANAASFGFCQPYTPKGKERPDGYNEEKWHWSYLPLSVPLINQAKLRFKNEMVQGFKGSETATEIDVVKKYVLGINQECL